MSNVKTIPQGYLKVQIILHWIVVILIGSQYLFKNTIASAWDTIRSGEDFAFHPLILLHVVGGSLILIFMVWRLVLRVRYGVPASPENDHAIFKVISRIVHVAFYVVLILMSLSGLAAWFGDVVLAAQAHNILKVVLLALIAMHILAVPFHHIVLKSPIMKRMTTSGD
ncbi:cytochrome b [Nitrincola schmidtii]|uniref:cytochrome b n=1 Tax=Nitrincola schmidtii TaxID=1730894 RepID=UPI00124C211E|nr:cytochrome b/b6 domain-containing protein [Nitrincola schmidtii]